MWKLREPWCFMFDLASAHPKHHAVLKTDRVGFALCPVVGRVQPLGLLLPRFATQSKQSAVAVLFNRLLACHWMQPLQLFTSVGKSCRQLMHISCCCVEGRLAHAMQDFAPVPHSCTCTP